MKEISVPSGKCHTEIKGFVFMMTSDDDNDAEPQQSSIEESFETHATPSEQAKELSVPSGKLHTAVHEDQRLRVYYNLR